MPRCCPGALPPKIEEGRHFEVAGTGTPQDPYVLSATTALDTQPNETFNILLYGNGTLESPWLLEVIYAPTSSIDDLGDVATPAGTPNGYVLAYDTTNGRWRPAPPSVAPTGSVSTGNGMTGDGSSGLPLTALANAARFLEVTSAGIGLSDAGLNRVVRQFSNASARAATTTLPIPGTVSTLLDSLGRLDQYNGTEWIPVTNGQKRDIQPGQMLSLSGGYTGGDTTTYIAQLSALTDGTGAFEVISSADLAGYSGVLSVVVQETGSTPWHCHATAGLNNIIGTAYDLSGGARSAVTVTGTVTATLY